MRTGHLAISLLAIAFAQPASALTMKVAFSGIVDPQFDPNFMGTNYSFSGSITYVYNPADLVISNSTNMSYEDVNQNALETATLTIVGLNGGKPLTFTGPDTFNINTDNFPAFGASPPSQNYNISFSDNTGEIFFQFGQNLQIPAIPNSVTTPFSIFGSNITGVGSYSVPGSGYGDELDATSLIVTISTVPLPAAAPMFGAALLALAGLGYAANRKKAAAAA